MGGKGEEPLSRKSSPNPTPCSLERLKNRQLTTLPQYVLTTPSTWHVAAAAEECDDFAPLSEVAGKNNSEGRRKWFPKRTEPHQNCEASPSLSRLMRRRRRKLPPCLPCYRKAASASGESDGKRRFSRAPFACARAGQRGSFLAARGAGECGRNFGRVGSTSRANRLGRIY
jgi:hypothetical protein